MTDVLTLGEALLSLRTNGPLTGAWQARAHVAGAESNVAIGLARLGHSVAWLGCVSDDPVGDWVATTLAEEGVDTSLVRRAAGFPGAMVLLDPDDHARRAVYLRAGSAGAQLGPADVAAAWTVAPRVVHLSGITPALGPSAAEAWLAAAQGAAEHGAMFCLDVNHRPALWSAEAARAALAGVLDAVTILVASTDELPLVASGAEGDAVRELLARGVAEVVVKRGAAGASVFVPDGATHVAAPKVGAVDVIGAGDALGAGYLSGRLDGLTPADALGRGVQVASRAVAVAGDWEGLPRRADLDA